METRLSPPIPPSRASRIRAWHVGLLVILGFTGAFAVGLVPRLHRQAELAASAHDAAVALPMVTLATADSAPMTGTLELPGEVRPYQEAALYARSSGYLRRRLVDIGDHVKAGQLLADIESPELDKELGAAMAAVAGAEARLEEARTAEALARTTAARWAGLRRDGSVAPQEADEKVAAARSRGAEVTAAQAAVRAARQNVQRVQALARYLRVVAPFAGIITARGADPGALIGTGGASAPLFKLVQADRLRIALNVPQTFAAAIHPGMPAQVTIRELGRAFAARITRTSGALDPATRTLLAEVELKNDGRLLPGMYARVHLETERTLPGVTVPGTALVTRAGKSRVAVVGADGRVAFRTVEVVRDDGTQVELAAGVKVGEAVVIGPSDAIVDGVKVQAIKAP